MLNARFTSIPLTSSITLKSRLIFHVIACEETGDWRWNDFFAQSPAVILSALSLSLSLCLSLLSPVLFPS